MNLIIERANALSALSRVVGVVERKQTIPILGNVAITAEGEGLTFRATDLEMEVIETVQAVVGEGGAITVPADKLHNIVNFADAGAQISLAMEDGDPRAKVKSGRSRFSLPTLDAAGFPKFRSDGLDEGFDVPAADLANLISRVIWSIDSSDRITVKGVVRLAVYEGELHAVGASSSGVALRRQPAPAGAVIGASLPAKVANHLIRWLSEAEGLAHVATSEGLIQVKHGTSTYTAKLFDAPKYFAYEKNIFEDHDQFAKVAQDALNLALKRVMIMADGKTGTLKLTFSEGQLAVRARNDQSGDSLEEIGADYDGPEASVLIKGARLGAALDALKGDIVEFGFCPEINPLVYKTGLLIIRAPCDPGLVCNIMQMKA